MTNRRTLILSVIACIAGTGALRLYVHRLEIKLSGGPPVRVLAWTRDAQAGDKIGSDLLGIGVLPRAYVESRHVPAAHYDEVLGGRLAASTRAGETTAWHDLAAFERGPRGLSDLVPPGLRAFRVARTSGDLDGLVRPGDGVDVLLTREGEPDAATLIERALVLAVGDSVDTDHESRTGARSDRVTLAVRPAQARMLAAAERRGALRLVLRHPDDFVVDDPTSVQPVQVLHAN